MPPRNAVGTNTAHSTSAIDTSAPPTSSMVRSAASRRLMPRSLREVKVGSEHFDRIAQQAMATPWVPRNPRKIEGPAQVREILDMAA